MYFDFLKVLNFWDKTKTWDFVWKFGGEDFWRWEI